MTGGKGTRGYRVWDAASEEALKAGVRKHGLGAWEHIRKDPQFAILSDRTGVQLKDKWRNLVKFRHIDPDEQRTYKPKTQGPWSKKYKRERSQGPSGGESPGSGDGGLSDDGGGRGDAGPLALPEPGAMALGELQATAPAQRQSARAAQKRKAITDLALLLENAEDDDEPGPGPGPGSGPGYNGLERAPAEGSDDGDQDHGQGQGHHFNHPNHHPGLGGMDGTNGLGPGGPMGMVLVPQGGPGLPGDMGGPGGALARQMMRQRSNSGLPRSGSSRYRKVQEDRRFGIYDRRRYGFAEDGQPRLIGSDDGDASDGGMGGGGGGGAGGGGRSRNRRSNRSRRSARMSDGLSDEDDEDEDMDVPTEDDDDDGGAADDAPARRGGGGASDEQQYKYDCPCGVTYDDGSEMIECELCAAWAHTNCLRRQMETRPDTYSYDFASYQCHNCQCSLQDGGLGGATPGEAGRRSRRRNGSTRPAANAGPGAGANAGGGLDGDSGDDDDANQRKELSSILLELQRSNDRFGSTGSAAGAGARRSGSGPSPSGLLGPSKLGPYGRPASAGPLSARNLANGSTAGGLHRSGSGGHMVAGADGGGGAAAAGIESSIVLLKPGSADPLRRAGPGPTNSSGSRGRLEGAASPPPLADGLPLFHAPGTAGMGPTPSTGSGGSRIFKPIPKLATAAGAASSQPTLSAPKAMPHPALQRGASHTNMQRMLEAANPGGGGAAAGGGGGPLPRGLPLASVLDAVGPLQVAAANLCAASAGRKGFMGSAGAGGGSHPHGAECVASSSDAAAAAAGLPPRPPSRPPSSMAREVANRIFGEVDDDDDNGGGLGRPLSALGGRATAGPTDPWFLLAPSLSRAATPSVFIDQLLRATPDIVPLTGSSPPPHALAALAAVRSASPGAAYLPALLAQQQQHAAAMQQFLAQNAAAGPLPPAAIAAAAATLLPPPPLARPTPMSPPPPPFIAPPLAPPVWPPTAPPPPPPPGGLPPSASGGNPNEPVTLHPVLRHLLQQQMQTQAPRDPMSAAAAAMAAAGIAAPPPAAGAGATPPSAADGGAGASGVVVKEEQRQDPSPATLMHQISLQSGQPTAAAGAGPGGDGSGAVGLDASAAAAAAAGRPPAVTPEEVASTMARPASLTPPLAPTASIGSGAAGPSGAAAIPGAPPAMAGLAPPPPLGGMGSGTPSAAAAAAAALAAVASLGGGLPGSGTPGLPAGLPPGLIDGSGGSGSGMAALLGLGGVAGLGPYVLDHLRSSSPDPWGFFRTSTPGPEALLQGLLHPPPSLPADINSLPWLKSATPPLSVAELLSQPPPAAPELPLATEQR